MEAREEDEEAEAMEAEEAAEAVEAAEGEGEPRRSGGAATSLLFSLCCTAYVNRIYSTIIVFIIDIFFCIKKKL
jgi:hypothetical protein